MGKERKLSKGGFEDIYPELIEVILTNENPDHLAISAGLTKRQWDAISHYMDHPDVNDVSRELDLARSNIYYHLSLGFAKLEKWRKNKK